MKKSSENSTEKSNCASPPETERSISELQRVEVCKQILHIMLVQLITKRRHHLPAIEDRVSHMLIGRSQAAGKVRPLEYPFQSRPFVAMTGIGRVAADACDVKNASAPCLLRIQAQLGIRHLLRIFAASGKEKNQRGEKKSDGRVSHQMTIMSVVR